jgi:ATP citrate (pro-S)-lyase
VVIITPATTFIDYLLRYEADPECKMLVLGEVGGIEEYRVIEGLKSGKIKQPTVAWAIGTCATMFTGSMASSDLETADAKNRAMRDAEFVVPDTFEELPRVLKETYEDLVRGGTIVPKREVEPPVIPMDYKWAQELGLIRKPAAFISTISDERGQELLYAGMKISEVFREDIGRGSVVSLLWFKRRTCFFFLFFLLIITYSDAFYRSPSLGYQVRRDGYHAYCRPCLVP